jgi:hypothetical protein
MRNSFNRLYHIHLNCFKLYNDLASFAQYTLRFAFVFGIEIPSGTFTHTHTNTHTYMYVQQN